MRIIFILIFYFGFLCSICYGMRYEYRDTAYEIADKPIIAGSNEPIYIWQRFDNLVGVREEYKYYFDSIENNYINIKCKGFEFNPNKTSFLLGPERQVVIEVYKDKQLLLTVDKYNRLLVKEFKEESTREKEGKNLFKNVFKKNK